MASIFLEQSFGISSRSVGSTSLPLSFLPSLPPSLPSCGRGRGGPGAGSRPQTVDHDARSSLTTHHIPAPCPAAPQPCKLSSLPPGPTPSRGSASERSRASFPSQLRILPWLPSALGKKKTNKTQSPPCTPQPLRSSLTRPHQPPHRSPVTPSPLPPPGLTGARQISDLLG